MRGIDRNVIKWLDSLDLGISYSHPKRDFANGYIIAAIFAHYYPGQLQPCTLYTGNSEQQKQNNWVINSDSRWLYPSVLGINLVFAKNNINIPKLAIEAVMKCQNGAAVHFIENIYTLLTKKPVKHLSEPETPEIVPHFALPTTSNAIKIMSESPAKAKVVLEAHQEFLKELRKQRRQEIKDIIKQQQKVSKIVENRVQQIKVKQC
ncbi:spermatogenesis-associated protein 4 [Boothiomyces sp. JEL0838]|nr:spermatogenesis-associated protein 4 [Boothiomyces sp. JEL0838]KAJ3311742.1 spermatogenesis-associated protein 4 [Boothiomyces sp. JEL0838]